MSHQGAAVHTDQKLHLSHRWHHWYEYIYIQYIFLDVYLDIYIYIYMSRYFLYPYIYIYIYFILDISTHRMIQSDQFIFIVGSHGVSCYHPKKVTYPRHSRGVVSAQVGWEHPEVEKRIQQWNVVTIIESKLRWQQKTTENKKYNWKRSVTTSRNNTFWCGWDGVSIGMMLYQK